MRRILKIVVLSGLACLVVVLGSSGWTWWQTGRFEEATDNAYLRADITSLAPKVAGYVVEVGVEDNQQVKAGDVLFRIDDRDYKARLAQAEANIVAAEAALANLAAERGLQRAAIEQSKAQLDSAVAAQTLARLNFERYTSLTKARTASRAQFEQSEASRDQSVAAVSAAKAALQAATKKLDVLAAQEESAKAALAQTKAARDLAQLDLDNTVVKAPVDGVVGNRQVRVGRFVTTGASLLDIVPVDDIWIVANFKEVQLERIKSGQPARIQVDGYPDLEIRGTVASLAPGTGSAFSLIPSDNATGNFVRVVQRVPVKIILDENPMAGRLVPGLSARVAVRIAGSEGEAR
ncbi:HlyD family secretion protein [Rhizobiaceae bacterium n13]|uniref:HlyD family secretion protein n=1 Tax=Ferirhizobium litorale TaxID=2927786 RepID=A0AAE3QH02_9HYPH|nr:HlyD family secretion protein [Fererhizobium litorale]MDI7864910.1 HlyD family secretion protein [Fererhizobium litorale]MDI7925030.1 HlyD family secretion protein [Fererhizobium litorale]